MKKYMRIHPEDNVVILLYDGKKGDKIELDGQQIVLKENVPYGHKASLQKLGKGDVVKKYNQPIGAVTEDVEEGAWVHIHNMKSLRGGM